MTRSANKMSEKVIFEMYHDRKSNGEKQQNGRTDFHSLVF
jgi:hypothetical protein